MSEKQIVVTYVTFEYQSAHIMCNLRYDCRT